MTEIDPNTPPVDPAAQPPVAEAPAATEPAEPPKKETDWKAEARKHEQRAKENAAKAKQLDEILEAQKSDAEKLADKAAKADARALAAERRAIALEHGLSPELAARLQGSNVEELAADAAALKALMPAAPTPPAPPTDVDQGVKGGGVGAPPQLTQADLAKMTDAQIVKAKAEGRLNDLLGVR